MAQSTQFRFAPFRLYPSRVSLWRDAEEVVLPPKVFDLLCYLVRHAGELVTKDQLLDEVWQRRFVSESSLKSCMNELRKALGDDVKAPRYIATVARRGYRFIAPVSQIEPTHEAPILGEHVPLPEGLSRRWVKRASLLARLHPLWRLSLQGARQLVFLTGEAGIGKTTLIEMFLAEIAEQAPSVLRARCIEHFGQGEALLPLLEAIEHQCRTESGAALIARLRRHAPVWLAQLPSVLEAEERATLQREILGASRERMLREGCLLLEELCGTAPLVLVVEDLHWSDHATLGFLALLAQRNLPARLLVLASYRPGDAAFHTHPVTTLHQELHGRGLGFELPIEPFSPADAEEFLVRRFPGVPVPHSVVQALYAQTGGHPLFLANLVDYLVAQRQWSPQDPSITLNRALPETVRRVIDREIERLNAEEQRVLGIASAIGAEFSVLLLGAIIDAEPVDVDRCCEGLVRRGRVLLAAGLEEGSDGTVVGRYAFRHALYVEVLYQRLGGSAGLIRLHRRIGECLEGLHDASTPTVVAELALHFERGQDWVRAVRYLAQAAEHSARRFANREALAYLSRALALVHRLPASEQVATRVGLLLRQVLARSAMDDLGGAIEDLKLVLACAREKQDKRLEVNTLVEISRIARWLDIRYCLETATAAEERSRDLEDEALKVRARVNCAMANLRFTGWRQETAATCRSALAVVRAAGDPRLINTLLFSHAWMECLSSNYERARQVAGEGMGLARSLDDAYHLMTYWWFQLWSLLYLGELGEVRRGLSAALSMGEKNGNSFAAMAFRIGLARLHEEALDFDGARGHCEQILNLVRKGRDHHMRSHGLILSGRAHLGLQDHRRAYVCFSQAMRLVESEPGIRDWMLCLPLYQGLVDYWLAQGDLGQAREMATKLCALAALPPERTYLALGHRLLAEIAIADGQWDQAKAEVAHALTAMTGAQAPSTEWRAYAIAPPECASPSARTALPLAAWRVHATAAKLRERQGRPSEAEAFRQQSRAVIQQLADSLDAADPLRESLTAQGPAIG